MSSFKRISHVYTQRLFYYRELNIQRESLQRLVEFNNNQNVGHAPQSVFTLDQIDPLLFTNLRNKEIVTDLCQYFHVLNS